MNKENKIAVIKIGGKQYKVRSGETIKVEKLSAKEGDKVKFDTLLVATTDGKEINLGQPSIADKKVEGKIIEHGRSRKVTVVKFKNKTRYLRTKGHRQHFTKVEITKI
jgi:large subunit ribosomal protein L21